MSESLIEAVRNHSVLYDLNHPDYLRAKLKVEIWDTIARQLNMTDGAEAKSEWTKLRSCHREALRRQRGQIKSGAAATAIKQWKFQKQMMFLTTFMSNRSHDDNWQEEIDNFGEEVINNVEMNEENATNDELNDSVSRAETPKSPENKKRKQRDHTANKFLHRHEQRAQDREIKRKKMKMQKNHKDNLYYFFMSMYGMTRNMSSQSQHAIKNTLFAAVAQEEAKLLNIHDPQPSQFPPQHLHNQVLEQPHSYQQLDDTPTYSFSLHSSNSSTSTPLSSPYTHSDTSNPSTSNIVIKSE